jgi:hypothetical protein
MALAMDPGFSPEVLTGQGLDAIAVQNCGNLRPEADGANLPKKKRPEIDRGHPAGKAVFAGGNPE